MRYLGQGGGKKDIVCKTQVTRTDADLRGTQPVGRASCGELSRHGYVIFSLSWSMYYAMH